MKFPLTVAAVALTLSLFHHPAFAQSFVEPGIAFQFEAIQAGPGRSVLTAHVRSGFAIYVETLQVVGLGTTNLAHPTGQLYDDPAFGPRRVFAATEVIGVSHPDVTRPDSLTLKFQGCRLESYCYPPQRVTVPVTHLRR